ncbi:uncharacterized protein PADG_08158 [Paracoccidioides brasiliensis Pb18]|uniref:DNA replication factor Cdt1 C-terminal domain-containing protein n=1 Tax=Paracoccidioides brasiliensis (strain Pb18) TaxID=502780 RepID=C1GM72_PARBD|nr:uncharacterized protein PADG_08158 [Paracoccidioides brasiliensis Pb18]EEH43538.1 hypothetical protein PADG_08158 [Paracoccidioides brasiliensis Pb18]
MGPRVKFSRPSRASTRCLPPQQTAIQEFAKATKSRASQFDAKDVLSSKKRKVGEIEVQLVEVTSRSAEDSSSCDEIGERPSKGARLSKSSVLRSKTCSPPSPSPTTRSTSSLTPAKKALTSGPSSLSATGNKNNPLPRTTTDPNTNTNTNTNTNANEISDYDNLPQSFHDLIALHSSFLSALSLHYSHNGLCTPADLNLLLPSTEKIWKKRKVHREDLQRLLYILESDTEPACKGDDKSNDSGMTFRIANYGIRKTCLEFLDPKNSRSPKKNMNNFGPPFDEAELNAKFRINLQRIWRSSTHNQSPSGTHPTPAIPLAPIHDSTKAFTSLRIGQQRLLDFKRGMVGLKAAATGPESGSSSSKDGKGVSVTSSPTAASRRSGLLQRIQNKQLKQTTLAPPPTKEALLRRSAVDLVEEVVGVLILLRPASSAAPASSASFVSSNSLSSSSSSSSSSVSRATFTTSLSRKKPYRWNTIIQNIRDSLRCPISKQEAEACLDLLAQPSVAGEWVSIVTVNRIKSVVLRSGIDVFPCEIRKRVEHLKV